MFGSVRPRVYTRHGWHDIPSQRVIGMGFDYVIGWMIRETEVVPERGKLEQ